MAPVELEPAQQRCFPPSLKQRYRVAGEGGPLGVGRCSYSLYKDILVNPGLHNQGVSIESFVGECGIL